MGVSYSKCSFNPNKKWESDGVFTSPQHYRECQKVQQGSVISGTVIETSTFRRNLPEFNLTVDESRAGISNQTSASNTNTQNCITWDSYSSKLPPEGGRGGQWKAFKRLPPSFQNGCVLLEDNNSLDIAYILTVGLSPDPYKIRPLNSFQNVPAFNSKLEKELDKLVNQGKALKVTWLTPTNGAIPYLRSIPHDRAFLREDGMTCFSTVCMVSGALSHRELSDILTISGQSNK